jgi:hypothetical protein
MKTMAPAHAEPHLPHVADRFDEWRQTRPTRAAPIPPRLWEHAIAFTTMFSIARVATRLRVSGGELKKRCTARHAARAAPASTAWGFVAVTATPVRPTPTAGTEIELHRADGARLRIYSHEPQLPFATLVRTVLETPGCSS